MSSSAPRYFNPSWYCFRRSLRKNTDVCWSPRIFFWTTLTTSDSDIPADSKKTKVHHSAKDRRTVFPFLLLIFQSWYEISWLFPEIHINIPFFPDLMYSKNFYTLLRICTWKNQDEVKISSEFGYKSLKSYSEDWKAELLFCNKRPHHSWGSS